MYTHTHLVQITLALVDVAANAQSNTQHTLYLLAKLLSPLPAATCAQCARAIPVVLEAATPWHCYIADIGCAKILPWLIRNVDLSLMNYAGAVQGIVEDRSGTCTTLHVKKLSM